MKRLTLFLMIIIPHLSYPQGVFTNSTHSALQQVIGDYPAFRNIKGSPVNQDPQSTDYKSSVVIPGALNTFITKYSSNENEEIYSWKCVLLESEDFDAATTKYRELYNQICNSIIRIEGEKPFILNGPYVAPTEEKRFNSTVFQLLPAGPGNLKKMKVELTLEYYVTEWKLMLLVYNQEEAEAVVME